MFATELVSVYNYFSVVEMNGAILMGDEDSDSVADQPLESTSDAPAADKGPDTWPEKEPASFAAIMMAFVELLLKQQKKGDSL